MTMPTQSSDRRGGADRRRVDRRQLPRREWGRPAHAGAPARPYRDGPSTLTAAFGGDIDAQDSGLPSREARRVATATGSALGRILRTYVAARAAVGLALVGAQVMTSLLGVPVAGAAVTLCVLYAVQAALLWLLPSFSGLTTASGGTRFSRRQWLATIGVDLVSFGLLHVLDAGASFNYAALLVLPVLMSGVLTSRVFALGTAAAVALLLLAVTLRAATGADGAVGLAQSGLAGIGLFAIVLMAGELALRLAREELAARGSLELALQQAQLNRLVIEEMADGVLVLDKRLRVRAANPAARHLLAASGMAPVAPVTLRDQRDLQPLCDAVGKAFAEDSWPEAGQDIQLHFADGSRRSLRMRVRFTRRGVLGVESDSEVDESSAQEDADSRAAAPREPGAGSKALREPDDGLCVVLLEDVRTALARVQQEKLAAMGRVSAGVAHEIRNPLAAIAQANALMLEEALPATQMTLSQMVADNVRRLQRIVDDVLEVAAGPRGEVGTIDAVTTVRTAVLDWAQTAGVEVGNEGRVRLDLPANALGAVFDAEHLRRVLVNLLDNALRHGTDRPQAVLLRLAARDESTGVIAVASDGPPIDADVEPHLFEPFFSTRSRGSGLGLYICRELCERYGASIEYRARSPQDRHRNGFVVVFRRGAIPATDAKHST